MTTIRDRLLILLLPPLIGFILVLALFFYYNRHEELGVILSFGLASLLWVVGSVWFISHKISEPVEKLKDAALLLASGEYEESINVQGPQEIVELAGTLNTMRECLIENISRLTEYPLAREKLYGEYECAELLQFEMLGRLIEKKNIGPYKIRKASLNAPNLFGVRLSLNNQILLWEEAEQEGFRGIYNLLTNGTQKRISFDFTSGTCEGTSLPIPLLWSQKLGRLVPLTTLEPGDILLFYGTGLTKQMPYQPYLKDWFTKIFKHFSKDGIELTSQMIQSELNFLAKKHLHHEDIHIVLITLDQDTVVR